MLLVTYQSNIDNPSNQSCFSPVSPWCSPPTFTKKKCVVLSAIHPLTSCWVAFLLKGAPKTTSLDLRCQLKNTWWMLFRLMCVNVLFWNLKRKYVHWRCRVRWNYRQWFAIFWGDRVLCTTSFHITLWFVEHNSLFHALHIYLHVFMHSISLSQSGWTHEAAWKTMLTRNLCIWLQPPIAYLIWICLSF